MHMLQLKNSLKKFKTQGKQQEKYTLLFQLFCQTSRKLEEPHGQELNEFKNCPALLEYPSPTNALPVLQLMTGDSLKKPFTSFLSIHVYIQTESFF